MTFSQFAGVLVGLSPLTWLIIAAPFIAYSVAGNVVGRIGDWYFFDRKTLRLERRWYGTGSRVRTRTGGLHLIWEVEGWEQYERGPIVLLLTDPDGEASPRWAPLEDARPFQVPAFHPHLDHGFPRLTRYVPAAAA
jgi:hypothetical protein